MRAAYRSVERALPLIKPGQTLRFALMPMGQDPDDLIRDKGSPAMQSVLDQSVPLVDMLWQREVDQEPLDTPEAKAGLKDRIFKALRDIQHDEVRKQYQTVLLSRFDAEFGRRRQSRRPKNAQRFLNAVQKQAMQPVAMQAARERRLIGAILAWPELVLSLIHI